jgi:hypothetical protein
MARIEVLPELLTLTGWLASLVTARFGLARGMRFSLVTSLYTMSESVWFKESFSGTWMHSNGSL